MTLLPGDCVGPYEVTRELGRGGMGVVYLARDPRLERNVAIKALPAHLARDPERLARFEREAKIVASLSHPGIASVYALEELRGEQYLVMECVEGETLAARLQSGRLPLDDAVGIAVRIAEALEAAHERGVIHRDLKPGNVMLMPDGKVKVLDFGLARQAETAVSASGASIESPTKTGPAVAHSPTIPGAIMGTAGYMSPEQARGKPVDKRSDIFSFGCVLYEMVAGRRAFAGETASDLLAAVLTRAPQWDDLPKGAGPALRRVLSRCMEKDPARRYRDIGDVAHDLAQAPDDDAGTASGGAAAGAARSSRIVAAVAILAAVAAISVAIVLWSETRKLPSPAQFEKLTFSIQFITNARFASDGRTIVFSAARERMKSELFVLRPEDLEPRKLGADNVQLLAVSPTGELAILNRARYLSHRSYVGTLARMPLTDAPPREVLEDVTAADWSPDGAGLAVIHQVGDKSRLEYPIGKVLAESTGYLSDLRISPDGELLAFMAHDLIGDNRGMVVVIDRRGAEVARSRDHRGAEGLAWAPAAKKVFYSAQGPHGDYMVWALSMDGAVRAVLTGAANLITHDAHSDGRFLVSTETSMMYLVSRLSGDTGERDILSLEFSFPAAVSADGRGLLFTDESPDMGDNYAVRFQAAAGMPAVRLGEGTAQDLSPDGTSVLVAVSSVPPRLMIYPVGAGAPLDISADQFVSYRRARFFPDGKRVLVSGAEAGKGPRCYVRELPDGPVRPVTPEGTDEGRVSPDGLSVVARRPGIGWSVFPLRGGEEKPVGGLAGNEEVIRWSRDGRSLLILADRDLSPRIERFDIGTGRRTVLHALAAGRTGVTSVSNAVVSADEESYAYTFDRTLSVLYAVGGTR